MAVSFCGKVYGRKNVHFTLAIIDPSCHQRKTSLNEISYRNLISPVMRRSVRVDESPVFQKRTLQSTPEDRSDDGAIRPTVKLDLHHTPVHQVTQLHFTPKPTLPVKPFLESIQVQQTCPRNFQAYHSPMFQNSHVSSGKKCLHRQSPLTPYKKISETPTLYHLKQQQQLQQEQQKQQKQQEQHVTKPKYTTLNPASLCEIGSLSCGYQCYNPRFYSECPCKCPYPRNIEGYATLRPNYRRNSSFHALNLPRYKTFYDEINHYNSCFYCEECCCQNNRIKPAYSSYDICFKSIREWQLQLSQYPNRDLCFRSCSTEIPYPYPNKESTIKGGTQEFQYDATESKPRSSQGRLPDRVSNPNVRRSNSFTYSENYGEHSHHKNERPQVGSKEILKPSSSFLKSPKPRSAHARVTFSLLENSGVISREESPISELTKRESEPLNQKRKQKGNSKSFSDGEEEEINSKMSSL